MVRSKATTVSEYVAELPAADRAVANRFQKLAKQHLKGFVEAMEYGLPFYRGPGGKTLAYASQANYFALYVSGAAAAKAHAMKLDMGQSCIRFRSLGKIDWALVEELFRLTAAD